jgi:hypothetical protein
MKKIIIISFLSMTTVFGSCGDNSGNESPKSSDSVSPAGSASLDSAANNGILPPSAAPGNANNSSLADSSYPAGDSLKSNK